MCNLELPTQTKETFKIYTYFSFSSLYINAILLSKDD